MRTLRRIIAFVSKEILTIFVQPQLLLLLIVGPFLVLLAFGLGYQPKSPTLKTIIVQPPPEDSSQAISHHLSSIGPPIRIVEVNTDLAPALDRLRAREVDMVVVVPAKVQDTLLAGQSARLVFYHNTIDPSLVGYVNAIIDGATSQINRAILETTIQEQQASTSAYERMLRQLRDDLRELRTSLEEGDREQARVLSQGVRTNAGLLALLWMFATEPFAPESSSADELAAETRHLDSVLGNPNSTPQDLAQAVGEVEADVEQMLGAIEESQEIPPEVMVSPLVWESKEISDYQPGYVAYHGPTVLALLVQHLCITLAALSLVDERSAGATELFRASPVRPAEVLIGKFLAYALVVSVTALALVGLLIYGLHIPLLGDWRWFAVVLIALLAFSLNLGFLISALAISRSQAIQMSMLALLGSIFFSGFFVPLDDFVLPVKVISYSLPVTYGIHQLQQIVLRGEGPDLRYLAALVLWAIVLGILSIHLFRRLFLAR